MRPAALDDAAEVVAEAEAELGVEVGEGFVQQQEAGLVDHAAGEGDALHLAAGEGGDGAVGVLGEGDEFQGLGDHSGLVGAGEAAVA